MCLHVAPFGPFGEQNIALAALLVLATVNLTCVVAIVYSFNPADLMQKVWNFQEALAAFRAESRKSALRELARNASNLFAAVIEDDDRAVASYLLQGNQDLSYVNFAPPPRGPIRIHRA